MSDVHIASYIKSGGKFIPVEHFKGEIEDAAYVEGALEIIIDGVMISCLGYWDLIDQLWAYIVDGMEKVKAGEPFQTYWPDQPIKLTVTPVSSSQVLVERSGSSDPPAKVMVDKSKLISSVANAGISFFEAFSPFSEWDTSGALKTLRSL